MAEDSRRRTLVLALCAIVPIALVGGWLLFGGEGGGPGAAGRPAASSAPAATNQTPSRDTAERGAGSEAQRERGEGESGLAGLAERRQALLDERALAARSGSGRDTGSRSGSSRTVPFDDETERSPESGERSLGEENSDEPTGPTPEQIEELKRLNAANMPSPEVLQALMEDEPPMPSPAELSELRRRTAEMLDFPPEEVEAVRKRSNAAQPSEERLAILRERLEQEQRARGQIP